MLDPLLKQVAVIGAAGKMGRGISLLLLQEMARLKASTGENDYRLILVDADEKALDGLRQYLKTHLIRFTEKNINSLRKFYEKDASLVENADMIDSFVDSALSIAQTDTELHRTASARLVFEAVLEDLETKKKVYKTLRELTSSQAPYYFSNTSSIPISILNRECGLQNRIVGFHFYNPPAVQKLVELITYPEMDPKLNEISLALGKRLGKTLVPSCDVAGFIGNGHFAREISYACESVKTDPAAICHLDAITRILLLRPMGIFQLLDYVGLDVAQKIFLVMHQHIPGLKLDSELVDAYLAAGIKGGQKSDGSQKDGIFQYEKGHPVKVYSLRDKAYIPCPETHLEKPSVKDLTTYFKGLFGDDSAEAKTAQAYLLKSRDFADELVKSGVAAKLQDVNDVLQMGFAHAYGPANNFY